MVDETKLSPNIITLPRGGYIVNTKRGQIQFGSPPETIKDTMMRPESVPQIFVLPRKLFNWDKGISLGELEFPIYFNFFIKQKKTYIICTQEQAANLVKVLQEAVFGPENLDISQDFHPTLKDVTIPNLKAELEYYKNFTFSDLFKIATFVDKQIKINEVTIKINEAEDFEVFEEDKKIAEVPGTITYRSQFDIGQRLPEPYNPPLFGITCLGPSHGFDPTQNTSGFIIWLNHTGIMIDPPVNSTEWLEESNVNPKFIDSIILTHCHADHDAGTFQKILEEGKITIYTTQTILNSFLRKYSSLSKEPVSYLKKLFSFHPIYIGKPVFIHGGKFKMFYSLHSIPAMGFTVNFQNQSMVYSSDHQNDPAIHKQLLEEKVINEERYKELSNFPWDSTVIYHESGIPPLHTPIKFLNSLPEDVQKRMVVYHIAEKDFPRETGLTLAKFGIENTINLETTSPKFEKTYQILGVLKHLDFFQSFSIEKVQDFIMFVEEEKFKKDSFIIKKGTIGDKFYIIASGNAAVGYENTNLHKVYGIYEYFGELALLTGQKRMFDIIAETDVTLYTMKKDLFLSFISGTEFEETLKKLIKNRDEESWDILSTSKIFSRLTSYQKTWIESVLHPVELDEHGILIKEGQSSKYIYIIRKGEVTVSHGGKKIAVLKRGDMVGSVRDLNPELPCDYTFSYRSPLSLYAIKREDYSQFLEQNPGLLVKLSYDF
ncbi:MAG: cAMP/cGMP-dependent 3',5'-cyclic-AMP/GMP phosphodiesterase [Spirochaetales bacterium]|nr:cAMP/cGMP-dependent 3',5'-cyclic-AMP/GMP phosphodiesterase [Spirochaetales bacterium]